MPSPFDLLNQITDYFQSSEFQNFLIWAKIISYSVSLLLIFSILILLSRSRAAWWISERIDSFRKPNLPERMKNEWDKIKDRVEKGDDTNMKLAVIQADNMLDEVLKRTGLEGKDMGDRLEQLGSQQLPSFQDVQEAHRLRDLIVHQKNIIVTKEQVEKAVNSYEEMLKELEVL